MICQHCGREAPTASVSFQYIIGLLILHIHKTIAGRLCKTCIQRTFWECTVITLLAGWWGFLAFLATPVLLVSNIIQVVSTRSLAPVPVDARAPQLDERALRWLAPHDADLHARLRDGERLEDLAAAVSARAGVTPGQVQLYLAQFAERAVDSESDTPPVTGAHVVAGPRATWTCSVCGGFVRQDAMRCKHCKASYMTLAEAPAIPRQNVSAEAHPVAGPRGSWTCSACHGYVRQDAMLCKHCKRSFIQ
jgi:hypothetical protein